MEQILLGDAPHAVCAFGQTVGIHFRHNPLHPDVNRESVNLAEAVEKGTLCNLFANTFDFYELISALVEGSRINFFKIDFAF